MLRASGVGVALHDEFTQSQGQYTLSFSLSFLNIAPNLTADAFQLSITCQCFAEQSCSSFAATAIGEKTKVGTR